MWKLSVIAAVAATALVQAVLIIPSASATYDHYWESPVAITLDECYPSLGFAVDASGNATAVWLQDDGGYFASHFTLGEGWGPPERIVPSGMPIAHLELTSDECGVSTVIWREYDLNFYNLSAIRYTPGSGWESIGQINSSIVPQSYVHIAAGNDGSAIAVWQKEDNGSLGIYSSRYSVGGGWSSPEQVDGGQTEATHPRVACHGGGSAVVIWYQEDSDDHNVYSNRYTVEEGWGVASPIGPGRYQTDAQVTIDEGSSAIAAWEWNTGDSGDDTRIMVCNYDTENGWDEATPIDNGLGSSRRPRLAMNDEGDAIVVWTQMDGFRLNAYASRYSQEGGWRTAEPIETSLGDVYDSDDGYSYSSYMGVDIDNSGNAVAVWSQDDCTSSYGAFYSVYSNRYHPESGWGSAELIEWEDNVHAFWPKIGLDDEGNALAIWTQGYCYASTSSNQVWSNRNIGLDIPSPILIVSNPQEAAIVESEAIMVSGVTEPGASVYVNGMPTTVWYDGSFYCIMSMVNGTNAITVIAVGIQGGVSTVTRTVTYLDPLTILEDEMSQLENDSQDMIEELDILREELQDLSDELNDSEDVIEELDTLREELQYLSDELADVRNDIENESGTVAGGRSDDWMTVAAIVALGIATVGLSIAHLKLRNHLRKASLDKANHLDEKI